MKVIDIILLLLLVTGAYLGYKKGLLIEILTFFAFILSIVSAFKLMHTGIAYFSEKGEYNKYVPFGTFVLLFILIFAGIMLLGRFLKNILDYTLLGSLDNWAGAALGACKMAFGISIMMWLMHHAKIDFPHSVVADTIVYPKILPFAENVVKVVSYLIPFEDIFYLIKKALHK